MISRITHTLIFTLCSLLLLAQPCVPNDTVTTTIYPPAEVNGVGGIPTVACKGKPFNFVWTMNIPSSATIGVFMVELDSVVVATTGAVKNLPANLTYSCNPPNCLFKPNQKGCIGVSGIVAPGTTIDSAELKIDVKIAGKAFGGIPVTQPFTLPDPNVTGPGKYILRVKNANDPLCTVGINNPEPAVQLLELSPVPALDLMRVQVEVVESGAYQMWLIDGNGRRLEQRELNFSVGANQTEVDVTSYPAGNYRLMLIREGRITSAAFAVVK